MKIDHIEIEWVGNMEFIQPNGKAGWSKNGIKLAAGLDDDDDPDVVQAALQERAEAFVRANLLKVIRTQAPSAQSEREFVWERLRAAAVDFLAVVPVDDPLIASQEENLRQALTATHRSTLTPA